jgi:hypothetical protein
MMNSRGEVDHGIHVSDGIPPVGVASNGFDQNVIPRWRGALGSPHNPPIALKHRRKMPTDEAVRARNKNPSLTVYHKMVPGDVELCMRLSISFVSFFVARSR